jgi:hypothetical protein
VLVEGGPVVEVLYTCESLVLWDDGPASGLLRSYSRLR